MKILAYLAESKTTVLLILILLVVQAFCELSLPAYFSDIVDVGVQQRGIENAVPIQIRAGSLEDLMLFMSDDESRAVRDAYVLNDQGNYELAATEPETITLLNSTFALPMAMMAQLSSAADMNLDSIKTALSAGFMTRDQLLEMKSNAHEALGTASSSLTEQRAVLFIQEEYEAIGVDVGRIQTRYLLRTGTRMLGLTIVSVLAAILAGLLASRTAAKVGMQLRTRLFTRVVSFSSSEIDKFSTASLITRSTNDVQQVQMVMVMLLRMILYAPILGIGGILKVSTTKTGLGWIIGVAVGIVMLVVGCLFIISMPKFKKMQVLIDRLNLVSREILTGLPVIRAYGRERHEEARFEAASRDLMSTQLFTSRTMSFMMPTMMFIMHAITAMIVWFGAKGIDLGNLQVGDMMAFITYTMQIVMSFMMLTMVSIMLPRATVAAGRIDEVLITKPAIHDKPRVLDDSRQDWAGVVEFRDVSFRFPGADRDVLEHVSFTARPGQTTAIIGSTGSGKSTLVHLLLRFYDVTSGSITIDGIDIRDISQRKLRSLQGFVPQKGVLFNGTIRSNLKFGGDHISDAAMVEAAQIAQATEFIEQKPDGYLSPIAQGGTNVSGGQRQRLSIARAIAKDPKILVFDDSFSALDYRTEVALRRALYEKARNSTVIVVAQRISTIVHADQIVVLDGGRVAGIGSHEQLLASCETYREIARSQLSEEELALKVSEA